MKIRLLFFLFIIGSALDAAQPRMTAKEHLIAQAEQQGIEHGIKTLWPFVQWHGLKNLFAQSNERVIIANKEFAQIVAQSELHNSPVSSYSALVPFSNIKELDQKHPAQRIIGESARSLGVREPLKVYCNSGQQELTTTRNHTIHFSQEALDLCPSDLRIVVLHAIAYVAQREENLASHGSFAAYVLKNGGHFSPQVKNAASNLIYNLHRNARDRVLFLGTAQAGEFGQFFKRMCLRKEFLTPYALGTIAAAASIETLFRALAYDTYAQKDLALQKKALVPFQAENC